MPGKVIEQFMWGFQPHFRKHAATAIAAVLKSLGRETDVEVYLIGFRVGEGDHPICVEPEDGYILPSRLRPSITQAVMKGRVGGLTSMNAFEKMDVL